MQKTISKSNTNNPRNQPILLALIVMLWTIGCFLFTGVSGWELFVENFYYWLPEFLLITITTIHFIFGCLINSNRHLMTREIFRLYSMAIIGLVTLNVGVRNASIGESAAMTLLYYFSVFLSISLMSRNGQIVMKKLEIARAKGWLSKQLNEKEWTWNPGIYVDLDGPSMEKQRAGRLKILEKAHYIIPAIASVISSVFGRTESFHIVGFVLIYLGIIFIVEVTRISGTIQQLRIWEIREGRVFTVPKQKSVQ